MKKKSMLLSSTILAAVAIFITNCQKSDSSSTGSDSGYSINKPSGVITGVGTGVAASGTASGKTALGGNSIAALVPPRSIFEQLIPKAFAAGEGVDGRCDSHAYPLVAGTSTRMNSSQSNYGSMVFFCRLAKNTGDSESVQGSYALLKAIACALENAGIEWDNASHSKTVAIDTTCFSAAQVSSIGASSMTLTVQAAKPAPFNSYYDSGAILTIPNFGVYRLGARIAGTKIEFGGSEDQSSVTANKYGAYAGSYDTSTGDLRFETRTDRFNASSSGSCGSSCGFGFHMRLYAKLGFDSSGSPTNVSTISGIIASVGSSSGQYYGEIFTADGDLSSTGVKVRYYNVSNAGSAANLTVPGNYTDGTSTAGGCYTSSSSSASTCGSGISIGSSTLTFVQVSGYTNAITWLNNLSSLAFTSSTMTDTQ